MPPKTAAVGPRAGTNWPRSWRALCGGQRQEPEAVGHSEQTGSCLETTAEGGRQEENSLSEELRGFHSCWREGKGALT